DDEIELGMNERAVAGAAGDPRQMGEEARMERLGDDADLDRRDEVERRRRDAAGLLFPERAPSAGHQPRGVGRSEPYGAEGTLFVGNCHASPSEKGAPGR